MIAIRVENQVPELMQKLYDGMSRFVRKGADYIEGQMTASMAAGKSGREYKRQDSIHIASAPGESPAVDSGNFINDLSIIYDSSIEARIGTTLDYPALLETGTPGGKISPRPLWAKTVAESLPRLEDMLAREIQRV